MIEVVHSLAVISLHTSPLVQPGSGDSGGMNVYVRELVASLAQTGVACQVYVRRWHPDLPAEVEVEPGFRVVHVDAGPTHLAKEDLEATVDAFTAGVGRHLTSNPVDAIHANYWLSCMAGHQLKHDLDLPLVSTFHTLARVKALAGDPEPAGRGAAEEQVIRCSDVVTASCEAEATQLQLLYGADPERIEVVPPGVDHAFFSPGDRVGARRALRLGDDPVLLFVGRVQPLKGLDVAVAALAEVRRVHPRATLVAVGGPSGAAGEIEMARCHDLAVELGVAEAIRWVPPQPHYLLSTYYRAADVVVVPSRSESFGLVALEAAACGVPVVASAVGGLQTVVVHGETGELVERRDPDLFAAAIVGLLSDPARADMLGLQAALRAQDYTWAVTAARLQRSYVSLTERIPVLCGVS